MIGPRVYAPQPPRDDLPVVVGKVREPAESCDVTGAEDARLRFERRRVHLQPAAFRLCESGCAPRVRVGTAASRDQQSVGATAAPDFKWTTTLERSCEVPSSAVRRRRMDPRSSA